MIKTTVVRARIDEQTKRDAEDALAAIGLTPSAAIRMLMIRIAEDKTLPFSPAPSAKTRAALLDAQQITKARFGSIDELIEDLNKPD